MVTSPHPSPVVAVLDEGPLAGPLATELHLALVDRRSATTRHLLAFRGDRLEIRWNVRGAPGPVSVDFVHGDEARRWQEMTTSAGKKTPLARAVGIDKLDGAVVDATAGLGRDAFALAALGCRVHAFERAPILAALLANGLERARASATPAARIAAQVDLSVADAGAHLAALGDGDCPAVVYLDPMFPTRGKSALVKKEMQLLQELLGRDPGSDQLLARARARARARTVVKRPRHAPPIAPDCDYSVVARRVRWDVYLTPR